MTYTTYLFFQTLIFMCAGHALCDFPLQGDFLAVGKNPFLAQNHGFGWKKCLFAHCIIHAGMVLLILRYIVPPHIALTCAVAEFGFHFATDFSKCAGGINGNQDQAIHYACKIAWSLTVLFHWL